MNNIIKNLYKINLSSWNIILGIFITRVAKNMVIPFFSVYLVENMHFSIASAGIAIAARIWGQRGFILFGGPITDYYGSKPIIVFGLLLMAISYFFTATSTTISMIVIWTLVLGFGSACYDTAVKTTIIDGITYEEKVFILSLRSTAINVGSAFGPVIGGLIFVLSPRMIFISTAIILASLSMLSFLTINPPIMAKQNKLIRWKDVTEILSNRKIQTLIFLTAVFYIFLIQIEITYPLFASQAFNKRTVSELFLLNALVIIVLQMPLSNWISKTPISKLFLFCMSTLGVGLFLTGFSVNSKLIFLFSVAIFSIGEVLIMPKLDSDISSYVSNNVIGTAFGILGFASAIGAIIGAGLGGDIYAYFLKLSCLRFFWIITGVLVISLGAAFLMLSNKVLKNYGESNEIKARAA